MQELHPIAPLSRLRGPQALKRVSLLKQRVVKIRLNEQHQQLQHRQCNEQLQHLQLNAQRPPNEPLRLNPRWQPEPVAPLSPLRRGDKAEYLSE